mmetsp:Transcript_11990/g.25680  ORF Transcript_11990/g.25680 Transcript_11990/m.25680 type:complete len:220 (+) Transcript_11990:1276-1935(+)
MELCDEVALNANTIDRGEGEEGVGVVRGGGQRLNHVELQRVLDAELVLDGALVERVDGPGVLVIGVLERKVVLLHAAPAQPLEVGHVVDVRDNGGTWRHEHRGGGHGGGWRVCVEGQVATESPNRRCPTSIALHGVAKRLRQVAQAPRVSVLVKVPFKPVAATAHQRRGHAVAAPPATLAGEGGGVELPGALLEGREEHGLDGGDLSEDIVLEEAGVAL